MTTEWRPEHIDLAQKADLFVIAPATANIIAKLAVGICDDLLTTTTLATKARVVIAPAMNPRMLEHPATQNNLAILENQYRYKIIPPETGEVACGDWGQEKWPQSTPLWLLYRDNYLRIKYWGVKTFLSPLAAPENQ